MNSKIAATKNNQTDDNQDANSWGDMSYIRAGVLYSPCTIA